MDSSTSPIPDWLVDALREAAPARRQRVLVLDSVPATVLGHFVHAVGGEGEVESLATPDAAASFFRAARRFDLVFAAPAVPSPAGPEPCLAAAHAALRPGGRMLLDLPAASWSDDLWRLLPLLSELGVALPPGVEEDPVRHAAEGLHLRDLQVTARTCLHQLADADELVDLAMRATRAMPDAERTDADGLRIAVHELLARRPPPLQTVLRRVRLHARR
ncbi:MAG: hypothetical protein R3F56_05555 [Planctomycetota bacterium]